MSGQDFISWFQSALVVRVAEPSIPPPDSDAFASP
jgi:hypothetical protein